MKSFFSKLSILAVTLLFSLNVNAQGFQGKAHYISKTTIDLNQFGGGRQLSEAQKKQAEARMKQFLEKTYVLSFNQEESIFKEDEKSGAPTAGGGRGFGGGFASSLASGPEYKNLKTKSYIQDQEYFGKKFLIKESMEPLQWKMTGESKTIGQYTAFKATTTKVSTDVDFTSMFRRGRNGRTEDKSEEEEEKTVEGIAWYTPQVAVSQGPGEYWGLPGLILEVSAGNITMICNKIVINPEEKIKIVAPTKGDEVTKEEYNKIVTKKMEEFSNSRGRGGNRGGGGRRGF